MDIPKKSNVYSPKNSNRISNNEKSEIKDIIENQSKINHSGNSNVDVNVNVEIDTKAIAYAILCSALAKKELTNDEFEMALGKLEELTSKKHKNAHNGRWDSLFFLR